MNSMKSLVLALVAIACLVGPVNAELVDLEKGIQTEAIKTGTEVTVKNAYFAHIRAGNGLDYNSIGVFENGTKLTVLGEKGRWSQVRTQDGKTGWIANWIIGRKEGGYKPRKATVTASALNFRIGPGTSYPTISAPLPRGTEVTIVGEANGWYRVKVNGKEGYVAGWFVQPAGSGDPGVGPDNGPVSDKPDKPDKPDNAPGGNTSEAARKILAEARSQVGTRRYQTALLDYGNLACAAYVSGVLKGAGVIRGSGAINTVSLKSELQKQGWKSVPLSGIQPGDVLFWGPIPGVTVHGHVGIIGPKEGGSWTTYQNSSAKRVPVKTGLNTSRQIVGILRHP